MADIIFDGHHLLHRVMRGFPDVRLLATSTGKPSGGAFSFLRSLRNTLLKFSEIDRAIVVFDSGRSVRRKTLYPEYKANRKPYDEVDANGWTYMDNFNAQIRILRFLLPKLGLRIVSMPGREGDDLMALIPRVLGSGLTLIATEDRDLLQLVSPNVHVWRPIAEEYVTLDTFDIVAGCRPDHFLLYKAIIGDKADNIIGVKNVGKKSMEQFLHGCPDIGPYPFDAFFDYLVDQDGSRAEAILNDAARVLLNCQLLDLAREEFSEEEEAKVLEACTVPLSLNVTAVRSALTSLEYFSLLEEFSRWVVRFQVLR